MADDVDLLDDESEADSSTPVEPLHPGAGFSVVDTFKQELGELASAESVMIPVRGYERTGLQIKYRMPESGNELDMISRKVSRQYKGAYERNLHIAIDTMVHLCDGLYVQPEDVENPVMLDPDETGEPATFGDSEYLGRIMGMNGDGPPSPRTVVRRLFGENELAILNHAERLNRWLTNTKADLDSELWQMGE